MNMRSPSNLDLAPRAKKHGACQRVRRQIGVGSAEIDHLRTIVVRGATATHARDSLVLVPGAGRRKDRGLPAPGRAFAGGKRARTDLQKAHENGLSRPSLCTSAPILGKTVTSRHGFLTLLQYRCRRMIGNRLFFGTSPRPGMRLESVQRDRSRGAVPIHKLIHIPAP